MSLQKCTVSGTSGGAEHGPIEALHERYFLSVAPPPADVCKYVNATSALPLVIQAHRDVPQWDGTELRDPLENATYKFTIELNSLP